MSRHRYEGFIAELTAYRPINFVTYYVCRVEDNDYRTIIGHGQVNTVQSAQAQCREACFQDGGPAFCKTTIFRSECREE